MDTLRVRVYNVRFGDAILVSVPDNGQNGQTALRHILIDFGNAFSGEGGLDSLFPPVAEDILKELDGKGLDLYILTHEHMDHVQGLLYTQRSAGFQSRDLARMLGVRHTWLTGSSAPDYYERFPQAKEKKLQALASYETIQRFLAASGEPLPGPVAAMMMNNNPRSTQDCVEFLRKLAPAADTWYVHRGVDLAGKHNFEEATFEIWEPEEDTSDYYGSFQPGALAAAPGAMSGAGSALSLPIPPAGVDAGAFYNLVSHRTTGWTDNLLAIDQAANNTSIVFCLNWRNWKLLFTGDAEQRSWNTMQRENVLKAVDFLKVGHHGSKNAMPPPAILDLILPPGAPRPRKAVVSTFDGTYSGVPHQASLDLLSPRVELMDTRTLVDQLYIDIAFEA
jgi:hypothetical protein